MKTIIAGALLLAAPALAQTAQPDPALQVQALGKMLTEAVQREAQQTIRAIAAEQRAAAAEAALAAAKAAPPAPAVEAQ